MIGYNRTMFNRISALSYKMAYIWNYAFRLRLRKCPEVMRKKKRMLKEIKCLMNEKGKTCFITLLTRDRGLKLVKSLNVSEDIKRK